MMTDAFEHAAQPDPDMPAVQPHSMLIAVMGYNRGESLKLAVDSIERHAPDVPLVVLDDGSTCLDTQAILRSMANRHRVLVSRAADDRVYLRGLHANMNAVLDLATREGFTSVFFVQDDQQIVRTLDPTFFDETTRAFRSDRAIVQVIPIFFKGFFPRAQLAERYTVDVEHQFYHGRGGGLFGIADIGILNLSRLNAAGFRFDTTENASSQTASRLRLRFVHSKNPVVMYTPWPATSRDHPEVVRRLNLGVHPFEDMSESEAASFCARPIEILPVAEDFLRTREALRRPWWYTAINDFTIREYNDFCRRKQEAGEL